MAVTVKANFQPITDYTYHAKITIDDVTADTSILIVTDPVDNLGYHSGQPQRFRVTSDGVTLTVTNLDTNQNISWLVGKEPLLATADRITKFYTAMGDILTALKQASALIASPRSLY